MDDIEEELRKCRLDKANASIYADMNEYKKQEKLLIKLLKERDEKCDQQTKN